MRLKLAEIKDRTGIGFGTSGIRGISTELTDELVYAYTKGFLQYLTEIQDIRESGNVAIAGDLRESTDRIMEAVAKAIVDCGFGLVNCGKIPTPAMAFFGFTKNMPSIMVTGSHIPGERNGIKFYLSSREVLKGDEGRIFGQVVEVPEIIEVQDLPSVNNDAREMYTKRYMDFFEPNILKGKLIGAYGHSAVGRDMLVEILEKLGASVVKIEYNEEFVAVDTEAISGELEAKGKQWIEKYMVDYIVSSDGDSDRPLISDEKGNWIRSDIVGLLAAEYLGIEVIADPISCNTALERSGEFFKIVKTKVGSPHVILSMHELAMEGYKHVAGYEANGGFLLESSVMKDERSLEPLATRDAFVVILSLLSMAVETRLSLQNIVAQLPARFTASDSVKDVDTSKSLASISDIDKIRDEIENRFGKIVSVNEQDGLRLEFENETVVHFRPSLNAPEFRVYTEASTKEKAKELSDKALELVRKWTS